MHRNRRNIRGALITVIFIVLVSLGFIGYMLFQKYTPSKEMANRASYYAVTDNASPAVILDNNLIGANGITRDGSSFIDYETVRQYLNDRFYFDSNEQLLLYTLPEEIVKADSGSGAFIVDGAIAYISLDYIQKYTNIAYEVYEDPGRVFITSVWGAVQTASVNKDTQLRDSGDIKGSIVAQLQAEATVTVTENGKDWCRVSTSTGDVGYVRTKSLSDTTEQTSSREFSEPDYTNLRTGGQIRMAWHQVTSQAANSALGEMIADASPLNTIAPTWFFITDTGGNIKTLSSASYVSTAHQAGLQVWAVVNDFDGKALYGGINSSDETYALLSSTSSRSTLESQLINSAVNAGVDGINVDFEKVNANCGVHYIQFIRELSVLCRRNGLVLSVDSYVPSSWTEQYQRGKLAKTVDYVVIMAYDEHGEWSEEIGPNSSVSYVNKAITDTLAEVPANEIIIAIPFYTRLWIQQPKAGTSEYTFTCETYDMEGADEVVSKNGGSISFDSNAGENLGTYEINGTLYSIWMEDETSITAKLDLMRDNGLAGFSAWKLGQEKSSIWSVIGKYAE